MRFAGGGVTLWPDEVNSVFQATQKIQTVSGSLAASKTLSFFDRLCICGNLLIQQQWQMVLNGPRWSNQAGPLCRYWCWYISVNVNKREKGGVKTHSSFYMSSMSHLLLLPVLTSFSSSQTPQQIIFLSGFRIPPSSQITPSVFSDFICC